MRPILPVTVDTANLLARLAERPDKAALLLDVDGTLAPIVERPDDAAVPERTRALLRDLAARYALVACVSGRPDDDLRRVVGVDGLVYVGEHGIGLDPRAAEWRGQIDELVAAVNWPPERKRFSVAFHYRTATDQQAAVEQLTRIAAQAAELGLQTRWGRKVLEVLPPVKAGKGTAVQTLLAERDLRRALYAGDDSTDLDAFGGLDGLDVAVRVAIVSDEGPNQLGQAADILIGDTEALVELLHKLL
jgi:trehalose 6-phosphate phosphatase